MQLEPELEALSVVCLGSFTPRLAQPSWLARHGLIPEVEADNADVRVISNEITQFATEWFTLDVVAERLNIVTQLSAYHLPLTDLAAEILRVLPSSEVRALGINHEAHFKLRDENEWHALGHRLVPKEFWTQLLDQPGTRRLTVEGVRTDGNRGRIWLMVEPSVRVKHGVFLQSNDHYDLSHEEAPKTNTLAADIISENARSSLERSKKYFVELLTFARQFMELKERES